MHCHLNMMQMQICLYNNIHHIHTKFKHIWWPESKWWSADECWLPRLREAGGLLAFCLAASLVPLSIHQHPARSSSFPSKSWEGSHRKSQVVCRAMSVSFLSYKGSFGIFAQPLCVLFLKSQVVRALDEVSSKKGNGGNLRFVMGLY